MLRSPVELLRVAHLSDEQRRWWFDVRDFELEKMMHTRGISSSLEAEDWAAMVQEAERIADALVHNRRALLEPRGRSRGDAVGDAHGTDRGEAR